jgi:hypothetical protein
MTQSNTRPGSLLANVSMPCGRQARYRRVQRRCVMAHDCRGDHDEDERVHVAMEKMTNGQ